LLNEVKPFVEMTHENTEVEKSEMLKQGTRNLIQMRQEMNKKDNNAVSQSSMEEGEIEVF